MVASTITTALSYFGAVLTICILGGSNISQIMKKVEFLYAHTPTHSSAMADNRSPLSSTYSLSSPSPSSLSCTTANEEVLNMGNRTRLGTGEKIILVGLPKAGTTSVGGFFQRAGYNTCDFRCGNKIGSSVPTLARCLWQAQQEHKPLLASCGGDTIEMYAQMDTVGLPEKGFCFFPQIDALDDLHAEHPNATFILNMRQVRSNSASFCCFLPYSFSDSKIILCSILAMLPSLILPCWI
jgi:Sulfotransferase domain